MKGQITRYHRVENSIKLQSIFLKKKIGQTYSIIGTHIIFFSQSSTASHMARKTVLSELATKPFYFVSVI